MAGVIFLLTDLISHVLGEFLGPTSARYWAYYVCAGCLDCIVVVLLSRLDDAIWVYDLMLINGLAVLAHVYGGLIWWAYWAPSSYNYTMYVLSAVQWLRLITVNKNDKTPVRSGGVYKYVRGVRALTYNRHTMHKR